MVDVAILGTGLIGGSIGLALRSLGHRVVAYDRKASSAAQAVELGAADSAASSAAEAVRAAPLVIVATPVGSIPATVAEAAPGVADGAVVTDVGSTKGRVVRDSEAALRGTRATFIGGHPMAGTEEEGIEAARPGLFRDAWWILTPTEQVDAAAYRLLHETITQIGAHVLAMSPDRHDDLLAVISHLPHLTATGLMSLAAERGREHAALLALAAGGFRDVTRVAASNPEIWLDICAENRDAVTSALEEFAARLLGMRDLVAAGDREGLRATFVAAREGRRGLAGTPSDGTLHFVWVPVPDRPGVLAEITTIVGDLGVNIEDLEISHSTEGGRGALRLSIAGREVAGRVRDALATAGFEPRVTAL